MKAANEFTRFISLRYDAENIYRKTLEQLASTVIPGFSEKYFTCNTSSALGEVFKSLKADCLRSSNASANYCNELKEIIKSLKDLLQNQKKALEDAQDIVRQNQRDFHVRKKKTHYSYMEYKKAMERMDENVAGYEESVEKHEFTTERKAQVIVHINDSLKNCKETERTYRIEIYRAKEVRNTYIRMIKNVLREVQKAEEDRIEILKNSAMKVMEEEEILTSAKNVKLEEGKNAVRKIEKDVEIQSIINSFNCENKEVEDILFKKVPIKAKEILDKFDTYHTRGGKQAPFDFQAARHSVLTGIKEGKDKRTQDIENNFAQILDLCWNDKDTDPAKMKEYKELIKDKAARKIFCECLNHYRKEGIFCMSFKAFSILTYLLRELLNIVETANDIDCALSLMILSQTYYCEQKELDKESARIYLQQEIAEHNLFKKREFWEQVLAQPLNENVVDSEGNKETVEEKKYRLENEVFVKAGTYAHNMLQFKLNRGLVEDIVFTFARSHNLSEQYMKSIEVFLT